MKCLKNAYYKIDVDFADKRPLQEVHRASYVYKDRVSVDITTTFDIILKKARVVCKLIMRGKEIVRSYDLDEFCGIIEAMGYQLGNHENERVTLTEIGEQELTLLTSIPYLSRENVILGGA